MRAGVEDDSPLPNSSLKPGSARLDTEHFTVKLKCLMSVDQLLPQILALDPFEREQLILEISDSLGERDGYFVSDSDVDSRSDEIDRNPDESTVGRDEFISLIQKEREKRRSSKN